MTTFGNIYEQIFEYIRVDHSPLFVIYLFRIVFIGWSQVQRTFVDSPQKSGNSKFSELYYVCALNLCLKTPGIMQKESVQSDHPALRKRSKHAVLLEFFEVGLKQPNLTTFWTFSLGRVIGLSWFLLHCARCLRTQV
jgi:hypothetical protein